LSSDKYILKGLNGKYLIPNSIIPSNTAFTSNGEALVDADGLYIILKEE
jgi:hypothetical protein